MSRAETGRLLIEAAARELTQAINPWGVRMVASDPAELVALIVHDARHLWESVGIVPNIERIAAAEALAMRYAKLAPSPVHQANAFGAFTGAICEAMDTKDYPRALREAPPATVWRAIVAAMGERDWWRRASLESVVAIQREAANA